MRSASFFATLLMLALAGCGGKNAKGSYLGGDDTGQVMLQISTVEGDAIKGTFTAVVPNGKGSVTAFNRPISGTITDKLVNLSVEGGGGLSLLTGTTDGDTLDLTGFIGPNTPALRLKRTDASKFAKRIATLRHEVAETKAVVESDRRQAMMDDRLVGDQNRLDSFARETMQKASGMADGAIAVLQIASDYPKARAGEERQREQVKRDHEQVRFAASGFEENTAKRKRDAEALLSECMAVPQLNCTGVKSAMGVYEQRGTALRSAYGREQTAFHPLQQIAESGDSTVR